MTCPPRHTAVQSAGAGGGGETCDHATWRCFGGALRRPSYATTPRRSATPGPNVRGRKKDCVLPRHESMMHIIDGCVWNRWVQPATCEPYRVLPAACGFSSREFLMSPRSAFAKNRAFTLVELLVVIG